MALATPVAPTEASRLNVLGCGTYKAEVRTRGGGTVLATLPFSSGEWNRVLDDTSEATLNLFGLGQGQSSECAKGLQAAKPWRTELVISRGATIVWAGPIRSAKAAGFGGVITAVDLSAWWWRRRIHADLAYTSVDAATAFNGIVADAMSVDNSPGIVAAATPTGVLVTRAYLAGQHMIAGEQIAELTRTAIDWTMVGRSVLAGGTVIPTTPIVNLEDRHLADVPQVTLDGADQANDVGVQGAGGGQGIDPVYGEAFDTAAQLLDGVLETVVSETSILDSASAAVNAASRLALLKSAVTIGDTLTLSQAAPVTIDQLVPGALVSVAFTSTAIPLTGTLRLASVKVGFGPLSEKVQVTLQPVGSS